METFKLILGIIILSNIMPLLRAYTLGGNFKDEFLIGWKTQLILIVAVSLVFLSLWLMGV